MALPVVIEGRLRGVGGVPVDLDSEQDLRPCQVRLGFETSFVPNPKVLLEPGQTVATKPRYEISLELAVGYPVASFEEELSQQGRSGTALPGLLEQNLFEMMDGYLPSAQGPIHGCLRPPTPSHSAQVKDGPR